MKIISSTKIKPNIPVPKSSRISNHHKIDKIVINPNEVTPLCHAVHVVEAEIVCIVMALAMSVELQERELAELVQYPEYVQVATGKDNTSFGDYKG